MNLMINTVHDLIHILKVHPEWRREVKQALFPGVDLEKALKELAEAQQRTEEGLQRLEAAQARNEELIRLLIDAQFQTKKRLDKVEKRLDKVEKRLGKIEQNQEVFKGDLEELKRNQRDLKGTNYENKLTNKANAIFGRYLKRGRDVRNEVGDHLDEAEENGHVSGQEGDQVFALDLLWGGKLKSSKQQVILAVEVSWLAEKHDVERAITRAGILRRIGLQALPVVAGVNWVDGLKEEALRQGVVIVNDKWLDQASWIAALAKV